MGVRRPAAWRRPRVSALVPAAEGGWFDAPEAEADETPESESETLRALATPLPDGSTLVVANERRRSDETLRRVMTAFAWALGGTIALGAAGGLWLSAQFLRRIDVMRRAARGIMAGDWSRRIPLASVDDDLSALARAFNRLFDRIETLLLANKHVSADIAHDLRKPPSHVLRRLAAAGIEQRQLSRGRRSNRRGRAEVEGVLETFDALLRIGQIEGGRVGPLRQNLDHAEIARDVVDAFRPAAEEQGRALVARLDEPLPLQGDRELLIQMIANCLDNALIHTPPGVRIEVEGARGPTGAMLRVADVGTRRSLRTIWAKLFDPFFRSDASRTSPGSGLGLRLVAAIAELHGLVCSVSDNRPGLKVTVAATSPDDLRQATSVGPGARLTPVTIARTRFSRWRQLASPTRATCAPTKMRTPFASAECKSSIGRHPQKASVVRSQPVVAVPAIPASSTRIVAAPAGLWPR